MITSRALLKLLREAFPRREWRMAFCDFRGDVVESRGRGARRWRRTYASRGEAEEEARKRLATTAGKGGTR